MPYHDPTSYYTVGSRRFIPSSGWCFNRDAVRICPRCRSTYAEETDFCGIDGERLLEREIDPLIGERIDRYEFVERLGGGAMGVVYRARHTQLDRFFAIKVLYGEIGANKSLVGRFRREAQAVSKINHPNIIAVVDFGTTDNGLNFLVMESVEGETLAKTLKREGALMPERAAWIATQVASGLSAAHRLGFIHRDVKPANVMLMGEPGQEHVKLLDFGIVGITDGQFDTKLTGTGRIVGTPRYMSPEQARGSGVGPAADLYSLGVVLYEMLAGEVPFPGDVMADVLVLHSTVPPPPLPRMRGLENLAMWLLEKRPEDRPAEASLVVDEIKRCFPELPIRSSAPVIATIAPFDEDQIPTAKPQPASESDADSHRERDDDGDVLETPELASDLASDLAGDLSVNLYDSGPDLSAPSFEKTRPTSGFHPAQVSMAKPISGPNAAIFSTLGTASDQIPAVSSTERSWWARRGPLIGMISLLLSLTALAIVFSILGTESPFEDEAQIAAKLQQAELRARKAEEQAKAALERAKRAERAAAKLAELEKAKQKPKRDALSIAERALRQALRERGLSRADLDLIPVTKPPADRWQELRGRDRDEAAKVVVELTEKAKLATLTNQLLWKKFARMSAALDQLEKQKPKAAPPLLERKRELKQELNQKRLTTQKRESIAKSLNELEREIGKPSAQ